MEVNILDNSIKILEMVKGYFHIQLEMYILEIGVEMVSMEKVSIFFPVDKFMMDISP
jgi:hypothetical protein